MQVKKRIFAGATCDQVVYQKPDDGTKSISTRNPRPRFRNDEERDEHKRMIARTHHAQLINTNFSPTSIYSTLTFAPEFECHDFTDARILRDRFYRRLRHAYPDARISIYMGKGKGTNRIHIHMLTDGIPPEDIIGKWNYGTVADFSYLREHNIDKNTGKDVGRDYTALANYLFDHWTAEQGSGKRYKHTNNFKQPEVEKATACVMVYDAQHPPRPPKGYIYTGSYVVMEYGYMRFHYVLAPPPYRRN